MALGHARVAGASGLGAARGQLAEHWRQRRQRGGAPAHRRRVRGRRWRRRRGWRLGGAFGYTDSRLSVDDLASRADISSYSAIVYGGKAFAVGAGKLNLMAGAAYSWHDIHTRRQIGAGAWTRR
ncbi:autotransporter domain-containing protein [Achromobacter insuavis]